ncbi:hypothetical protein [Legionella tunisiensis]|uniref:hypothetical protein n=1 Tax=Legionella tunisiensis TaxID=1034944 RepID=UPI000366BD49|nr:hypothetical protein [Legionella tunisiensis]
MVGNTTRTQFNRDLDAIQKAAFQRNTFWSRQTQRDPVGERYQRERSVQLAIHGKNFITSVDELQRVVSENYRTFLSKIFGMTWFVRRELL